MIRYFGIHKIITHVYIVKRSLIFDVTMREIIQFLFLHQKVLNEKNDIKHHRKTIYYLVSARKLIFFKNPCLFFSIDQQGEKKMSCFYSLSSFMYRI